MKKMNKKGFTLAELLIVVAIIAVLVAISIPIFTSQLERSREATDLANIRAAYAEAVSDYLAAGAQTAKDAKVTSIKQTESGWKIEDPKLYTRVNGSEKAVDLPDIDNNSGTVYVHIAADGTVTVDTTAPAAGDGADGEPSTP